MENRVKYQERAKWGGVLFVCGLVGWLAVGRDVANLVVLVIEAANR